MMFVDALIMAGGDSARMRSSGFPTHKALVRLGGVTLAEIAVRALIEHGFRSIAISLRESETELLNFARGHLTVSAAAAGARLHCAIEETPLGTIGAVRRVEMASKALLVVNVDNVSDIDLRALVDEHLASGSAMTIASHIETLVFPLGELAIQDGQVMAYHEKPAHRISVSSGTYVLSPAAVAAIAPNERISVPELYDRLRGRSLSIGAYVHECAWIDVNDANALARAHRLFDQSVRHLTRSSR